MARFPNDCWEINCPHCHSWDMSIDDWVIACDKLEKQCDACDGDYCLLQCPLNDSERNQFAKSK